MAFVDATIVNVAFPDIHTSFPDASIGDLSWILNVHNVVFAALLVAAGRLADVLGRRRVRPRVDVRGGLPRGGALGCVLVGRRPIAAGEAAPAPSASQMDAQPTARLTAFGSATGAPARLRPAAPTPAALDDGNTIHPGRRGNGDVGGAVDLLGRTRLFALLDERIPQKIAERSGTVRLTTGEWPYRRGDPAEAVYATLPGAA